MYFDDFKVESVENPMVQSQDYYPFGLTFNSYQRASALPNQYLFNGGSELQDELGSKYTYPEYRALDQILGL